MRPVYDFFFRTANYLCLSEETVSVSYKAYRNTYKGTPVQQNERPIKDAIDQKLNLGFIKFQATYCKSISVGNAWFEGDQHTMVLDTVANPNSENPEFIFKNTYDDEESGKYRKITIGASHANAPDVFYYVHVDVDLTAMVFNLKTSSSYEHFPHLPYKPRKSPLEAHKPK